MSISFFVPNCEEVEINMSNANAFGVMRELDIEPDYSGSIAPSSFLDKLSVAAPILPDHYVEGLRLVGEVALHEGKEVNWA